MCAADVAAQRQVEAGGGIAALTVRERCQREDRVSGQYILSNIVPSAAATLVGLAVLFLGFRSRLKGATLAAATRALFWFAAILAGALILAPVDARPWTVALGSAFIIWIGFVPPAVSIALTLRGNSWSTSLGVCSGIWWIGLTMNLSGSDVHTLAMYS